MVEGGEPMANMEDPNRFNAVVLEFLAGRGDLKTGLTV
jgi:hypothetical protein